MAVRKSSSAKPREGSGKAGLAEDEARGQALFDMANLRPQRTGLPFVVFISQKGGARDDVRVRVAHRAKARPSEMATVAVRPRIRVIGGAVDPDDLVRVTEWIELNRDVLVAYWNGDTECTEHAISAVRTLSER
jgi:hypothetical protein